MNLQNRLWGVVLTVLENRNYSQLPVEKDGAGRVVREFGVDMYTLLYLKWITAGQTHWGNQIGKRHVHPIVHHSTVYNSQDMDAT